MGSGGSNDPDPPPVGGVPVITLPATLIVLAAIAVFEIYGVTSTTFLGVGLVTAGGLVDGCRGHVKRTLGALGAEADPIGSALLGIRCRQRLSVNRQ